MKDVDQAISLAARRVSDAATAIAHHYNRLALPDERQVTMSPCPKCGHWRSRYCGGCARIDLQEALEAHDAAVHGNLTEEDA